MRGSRAGVGDEDSEEVKGDITGVRGVKERGAYLKHLSGRSHGLVESAESSSPSETAAAVDVRVPRVSAWLLGTAAEPALSESLQTAGGRRDAGMMKQSV